MDLEKAYNKIDNLCLMNYNTTTTINMDIAKGHMPEKIDFFKAYKDTKGDEDFCKDLDEMLDALETVKELVDLQKEIGCPLGVYTKIQLGLVDTIYVKRYETVREYWDENGIQLEQKECLQARPIIKVDRSYFRYQDVLGKEDMGFSEYGTEFWLREDKSE